ncbi:MAG TPA: glycosyltransferase [Desulfobacteraceae bacterium]|nr:glycosyltransferase [Desulfobacteraceae bacterium]
MTFEIFSGLFRRIPWSVRRRVRTVTTRVKKIASKILRVVRREKPDRRLRNRAQYNFPGRELHRFKHFPPVEVFRQAGCGSVKTGLLVGDHLARCLSFDLDHRFVSAESLDSLFEPDPVDMVLVESTWGVSGGGWPGGLAHLEPGGPFDRLSQACRRRNIPLVFWHTDSPVHVPAFLQAASLCDFVFASDPASVERYAARLSSSRCGLLPVAVQPALHNPVFRGKRHPRVAGYGILYDGWADLLEAPDLLVPTAEAMREFDLHVVESHWQFVGNKLDDLPTLREHIMGCLEYDELLSAFKAYPAVLTASPSLSSGVSRARRSLEALACGAAVLSIGEAPPPLPPSVFDSLQPRAFFHAADLPSALEGFRAMMADDFERSRATHLAWREIFSAHTYAHRIETIRSAVGLGGGAEKLPMVTVVTPTKRPELIERVLAAFDAQAYPARELILVVNRGDVDEQALSARIDGRPGVRCVIMHQERNIGSCLNHGIRLGHGEYWFKMDDDDEYGPNYISDMMLALKATSADVIGKAPTWLYVESKDALYRRQSLSMKSAHLVAEGNHPYLSGATFCGRREVIERVPFSETRRASVDTNFFLECIDSGLRVQFADPFNFIACRGADKNRHTWRAGDDALIRNSIRETTGKGFEKVML